MFIKRTGYTSIIIYIFYLFTCSNAQANTTAVSKFKIEPITVDSKILFKENFLRCPMYSEKCELFTIIKNDIPVEDLEIKSENKVTFSIKSLEPCGGANLLPNQTFACPSVTEFFNSTTLPELDHSDYSVYKVTYKSEIIGKSYMQFFLKESNDKYTQVAAFPIIITQAYRLIDHLFNIMAWTFGVITALIMGILVEKESLMKILKYPVAILIGFSCQYICMPLLSFSFSKLFNLSPIEGLALFIYGCSPGGAASNNWTILYDGDLNLSAILTFTSTLSALFMLPTWVYTLGSVFAREASITIPFIKIVLNLVVTVGPCIIGVILAAFFPKLRDICKKIAKPFTIIMLTVFLSLVVITKSYIFKMVKFSHWFSGPLIPWTGYLIGFGLATAARLPFAQRKTVAIETGIQNVGVAFLIVITNFPSPEADYAFIPLTAVALLTPIPLLGFYAFLKIKECIMKKKNGSSEEEIESSPSDKKIYKNDKPTEKELAPIAKNPENNVYINGDQLGKQENV